MIVLRPEIVRFAEAMELALQANDHKPGWLGMQPAWLVRRLREECAELEEALDEWSGDATDHARAHLITECADVANFALMIADRCGALAERPHSDAVRKAIRSVLDASRAWALRGFAGEGPRLEIRTMIWRVSAP